MRALRLGTRGSRLAVAQSLQVANQLRAAHADLSIELVSITTRGDRNRATPLSTVTDTDFFSAEIDRTLLDGHVDFTVHSRKDLDGPRPPGIVTAAMPSRANPRDIVLFRPDIIDRLTRGATLRIGTSSTRRAGHVHGFLQAALPRLGPEPRLECVPLRGPVDQRIEQLQDADPDRLDGVVLALAGLERLWLDPAGRAAIDGPLAGLRWMVLPLSECPTAPGQGALAVECRAEDAGLLARLRAVHDATTAANVATEYAAGNAVEAEQRAALGATAINVPQLGELLFARGLAGNDSVLQWQAPTAPRRARAWDGGAWHRACTRRVPRHPDPVPPAPAVFVAHWRALHPGTRLANDQRIWVSGWPSWQRLSAAGLWVEGCAEGLGFDALRPTLAARVLQLPPLDQWLVLTRAGAEATWDGSGINTIIGSYALDAPASDAVRRLRSAAQRSTHFFWSSREQYLALRDCLPPAAHHACGTGKTFHALTELGLRPCAFPNRKAWQTWLG